MRPPRRDVCAWALMDKLVTLPAIPACMPAATSSDKISRLEAEHDSACLIRALSRGSSSPCKGDCSAFMASDQACSQTCSANEVPIMPPIGIGDRPLSLLLCPSRLEVKNGMPMPPS